MHESALPQQSPLFITVDRWKRSNQPVVIETTLGFVSCMSKMEQQQQDVAAKPLPPPHHQQQQQKQNGILSKQAAKYGTRRRPFYGSRSSV
jgi:hypothetical protein